MKLSIAIDFRLARAELESKYEDNEQQLLVMSSTYKACLEEIANALGSPNSEKVISNALSISKQQAIEFDLIIKNQIFQDKNKIKIVSTALCDCALQQNNMIDQWGQLCLQDIQKKWYGYCADVAIKFSVGKELTEKQLQIQNA